MRKDRFMMCWFASLVGIIIFMCIMAIASSPVNLSQDIKECKEHEFVVTSEYNYFLGYKTVSKCINCGLVID